MAIILCIETATDICSIAISENDRILSHQTLSEGSRHSTLLTTLISTCLREVGITTKDISAVAISNGPGSYTGLRVGASTAKGICLALGIPLIAISTLESLAHEINSNNYIMPTIDARRMEVYAAIYCNGQLKKDVHSLIWTEESTNQIARKYNSLVICGNGIEKGSELFSHFEHITISPNTCDAALLVPLAYRNFMENDFVNMAYHDPFYYKSPNITTSKKVI